LGARCRCACCFALARTLSTPLLPFPPSPPPLSLPRSLCMSACGHAHIEACACTRAHRICVHARRQARRAHSLRTLPEPFPWRPPWAWPPQPLHCARPTQRPAASFPVLPASSPAALPMLPFPGLCAQFDCLCAVRPAGVSAACSRAHACAHGIASR